MNYNIIMEIEWPWTTKSWQDIKSTIGEKITSITDMDARVARRAGGARLGDMGRLLKQYADIDANGVGSDHINMNAHVTIDTFINKIVPMMQKLVITAPRAFKGVAAQRVAPNSNTTLTRLQVATLLAGSWFGLTYAKGGYDLIGRSIANIFESQNIFALQCLIGYFSRVYTYYNDDNFKRGCIIIKHHEASLPDPLVDTPIGDIFIGEGEIDDSPAKLHVVFAHHLLGGGHFTGDLSAEERVLLTRPECMAALLFCPKPGTGAVIVLGAEKFSKYIGDGSCIHYDGDADDDAPYGTNGREVMRKCANIFIDASDKGGMIAQCVTDFHRDTAKAYCGFSALEFSAPGVQVATGDWTYKHIGNQQIKFIQQLIAATLANKCIIYHTNKEFEDDIGRFVEWVARENITVGGLFTRYIKLIKNKYAEGTLDANTSLDIFEALIEQFE